jgi:hypothetical protein
MEKPLKFCLAALLRRERFFRSAIISVEFSLKHGILRTNRTKGDGPMSEPAIGQILSNHLETHGGNCRKTSLHGDSILNWADAKKTNNV